MNSSRARPSQPSSSSSALGRSSSWPSADAIRSGSYLASLMIWSRCRRWTRPRTQETSATAPPTSSSNAAAPARDQRRTCRATSSLAGRPSRTRLPPSQHQRPRQKPSAASSQASPEPEHEYIQGQARASLSRSAHSASHAARSGLRRRPPGSATRARCHSQSRASGRICAIAQKDNSSELATDAERKSVSLAGSSPRNIRKISWRAACSTSWNSARAMAMRTSAVVVAHELTPPRCSCRAGWTR